MVSVITPTYNSEKYLAQTIESVLTQSDPNWELILVDDGSIDSTLALAAQYASSDSRIKLLQRQHAPKGGSVCRNIGAGHAKGEYLIFLDADDLLLPQCLENRSRRMDKHPEYSFGVFPTKTFDSPLQDAYGSLRRPADSYVYYFLSTQCPWQLSGVIWRKEFFERLNGFQPSYQRLQDPEFTVRALLSPKENFYLYRGENRDYLFRYVYKEDDPNFLHTILDAFDLHYENVLRWKADFCDERKFNASVLALLIVQSLYETKKSKPERIQILKQKLRQHTGPNYSPTDHLFFSICLTCGEPSMHLIRGYLLARYDDIRQDRIVPAIHRHFVFWILWRTYAKTLKRYLFTPYHPR